MRFALTEHPVGWIDDAPIRLVHVVALSASCHDVFAVLADHEGWTRWFGGMRRVRVDGAASGEGALRTVTVPPARVQERFAVWSPDERLVLNVVSSNLPGLSAMTEDWLLEEVPGGSRLTITIGVEPRGALGTVPWLVRRVVARSTRGALGISAMFVRI